MTDSITSNRTCILEGIVTTMSGRQVVTHGDEAVLEQINIAPMGPIVDANMDTLILRPFTSSTTYRNLKSTGQGVFHVTDDALMIARGAIGKITARWHDTSKDEASDQPDDQAKAATIRKADRVAGVVLTGACRYYEFEVESLDDSQDRTRIVAKVIHTGRLRDFFGFCRAKHAVLEAAILATRLHLTGAGPVLEELDRLQTSIDKTGGDAEHTAMQELRAYVEAFDRKSCCE